MHYGIEVVPFGDFSDPRQIVTLAKTAEAAGWEGLWVWDHVLMPCRVGDPTNKPEPHGGSRPSTFHEALRKIYCCVSKPVRLDNTCIHKKGGSMENHLSGNSNVMEQHGCIVCGKVYNVLVVYDPYGKMVDCTVTSPGGHIVKDGNRPLVSCTKHTEEKIKTAVARYYPGRAIEESEDD
jgi:hypothetical protein